MTMRTRQRGGPGKKDTERQRHDHPAEIPAALTGNYGTGNFFIFNPAKKSPYIPVLPKKKCYMNSRPFY